ncbi:MAG TPA: hypothetical protein VLV29_09100 [Steroidobacteraceae bacterium]|nr:hypothetical protein [Steroidobacteraceae bacterium]
MNNKWLSQALFAALIVAIALPEAARAQITDNDGCSNATLRGDYAFTINGQLFPPGSPIVTRDGVAMTFFDGAGHLTQVDFVMQYPDKAGNSSPVPGQPNSVSQFNTGERGSYRVFQDCTGEMEIDFPPLGMGGAVIKARFVLSDAGQVIHTAVYSVEPPNAAAPIPALIHSEGRKLLRR